MLKLESHCSGTGQRLGSTKIVRVNIPRIPRIPREKKTRENVLRVRRNSREDISRRTSSLFHAESAEDAEGVCYAHACRP